MNPVPLGNNSLNTFLAEYWQKKPLLIPNAFADISPPASAEILAGLACEEHIESRLIIQNNQEWSLLNGPFNEQTFTDLPASHWTLLVQAVDHYLPNAAEFLRHFDFIPQWRIDDLMISVASDGGGVGPHYDQYDVFLVQTHGIRQWEVGGLYNEDSSLKKDLPLKILNDFEAEHTWQLKPGDVLYLPPGVGHNGIAIGDDCITCSVGFRAPSHNEILCNYTDFLSDQLKDSQRYQDPDLTKQSNSGEITEQTIKNIQSILQSYVDDQDSIKSWFTHYATLPKYEDTVSSINESYNIDKLKSDFSEKHQIKRNESSRFAFCRTSKQHVFYVDGKPVISTNDTNALIEKLCANITISSDDFTHTNDNLSILVTLLQNGALYLER